MYPEVMAQEQKRTSQKHGSENQKPEEPHAGARDEELTDDLDSLLDEIDDVLESDAETFVSQYIQKGGQ